MIGAIIGDIVGSRFEFKNHKTEDPYDFDLFGRDVKIEASREFELIRPGKHRGSTVCHTTDDSVLTCAVMATLMGPDSYEYNLVEFAKRWPGKGYGGNYSKWVNDEDRKAYGSWGNGSAMRCGPIGQWFKTIEETRAEAIKSAMPTHGHPEGIKGAEATTAVIFLARNGASKDEIRDYVVREFGYNLARTVAEIRPAYKFDVSCAGTVPEAIICLLESNSFEDAIRKSVSLGGDSDTLTAICGSMAEAFYKGVPEEILLGAMPLIEPEFQEIILKFSKACMERMS